MKDKLNVKTFCSGPWFHIQMDARGKYTPCRLIDRALYDKMDLDLTLQNVGLVDYFNSRPMVDLRQKMLAGEPVPGCEFCYYQDSFGQSSMRKRYLERSKLDNPDTFFEQFESSPDYAGFEYSATHDGLTNTFPIDLQIDLTNVCNSGCIMCSPKSSKNASAHRKLFKINPERFPDIPKQVAWSEDETLLNRFIDEITTIPGLWYIHFIGGETLYSKAFYRIIREMVNRGAAKNIMLGFITNGTIFNEDLKELLPEFKAIHMGISVETTAVVNEYIRYPVKQDELFNNIRQFSELRSKSNNVFLEFSVTPTVLSILNLVDMMQFSKEMGITMTCNALRNRPDLMIELLPDNLVKMALDRFVEFAERNNITRAPVVHDTCNPDRADQIMSNITYNYIDLLSNIQRPDDVDYQRGRLVQYLEGMELLRGNSILTYLPEFTDFLRKYGYKG